MTGGTGGPGGIYNGGYGGTAVAISTSSGTFTDETLIAIAGGSGGSGQDDGTYGTSEGGAAGYKDGYPYTIVGGTFIVYDGKDGGDATSGASVSEPPTGGKGGTTSAGDGGDGGKGISFGIITSPAGKVAVGYKGGRGSGKGDEFTGNYTFDHYGGGGGGSGFRGGGGGSAALIGGQLRRANDSRPSGGGGGSSAIRTSSFPDGILGVTINSIGSNQGSTTPDNGTQIVF